jgi:hypothetical protein
MATKIYDGMDSIDANNILYDKPEIITVTLMRQRTANGMVSTTIPIGTPIKIKPSTQQGMEFPNHPKVVIPMVSCWNNAFDRWLGFMPCEFFFL